MVTFDAVARRAGALTLAAALLGTALAPSAPAHAQLPEIRNHLDPYARVLVEIKRIIVHDDFDWGDAEIAINYRVTTKHVFGTCPNDGDDVECATLLVQGGVPDFTPQYQAKQLDRVIPSYVDFRADEEGLSPAFGIPIRPGQRYSLVVRGFERDPIEDDILGVLSTQLVDNQDKVQFGTHTERAKGACEKYPIARDDCWAKADGAFSVEYEVRPAPLPDLEPVGISVYDLPGSAAKLVCPVIKNGGTSDAGAFEATVHVDRAMAPAGMMTAGRLGAGEQGELCVEATLPSSGEHQLSVEVDRSERQIEFNERNNSYTQPYVVARTVPVAEGPAHGSENNPAPSPVPSPVPATTPEMGKSDLTVNAIRVNGRVPDGKDDCKDGKNDVTVVLKNAGTAGAAGIVVQLTVDGTGVGEQTVSGLAAGQEREVRFEDVRLKKGEHTLMAAIAAKKAGAESNEGNNERTVAARCQDDA
jgi:hypothetical protein